jgi:hypothetical protein
MPNTLDEGHESVIRHSGLPAAPKMPRFARLSDYAPLIRPTVFRTPNYIVVRPIE